MTREEAFRAGFENPLIGANAPLQRLYGTVTALGEELGGADMGTPVGKRFRERQAATKAEVKRLQKLREEFPEEFGRGQMMSQEQADPYMLGLGTMPFGMRPGVAAGPRELAGPGGRPMLAGPGMLEGEIVPPRAGYLSAPPPAAPPGPRGLPPAAPPAPYYRSVPPEMGTSMRPMTPFQQNQVGMATGRYGTAGYAPEMSVTDFETYGPMGARPTPGPYAPSGFDRNMLEAFRAGRANYGRNVRPEPMGGGFTLEELGQAVGPYRQGGLTYEPVGMAPQGGSNLPAFAAGRGLRPTMMEGEFREIPGIGYGGAQPSSLGYRPDVAGRMAGSGYRYVPETAAGMGMGAPSAYRGFGTGLAAAGGMAAIPGAMYLGDVTQRPVSQLSNNPLQPGAEGAAVMQGPVGPYMPAMPVPTMAGLPYDAYGAMSGLQGQAPAAKTQRGSASPKAAAKPRMGAEQGPPMAQEQAFDPNFNYMVTEAIDRILGQREAERGREQQERLARQGYYY